LRIDQNSAARQKTIWASQENKTQTQTQTDKTQKKNKTQNTNTQKTFEQTTQNKTASASAFSASAVRGLVAYRKQNKQPHNRNGKRKPPRGARGFSVYR
jgi:hypothetical protein